MARRHRRSSLRLEPCVLGREALEEMVIPMLFRLHLDLQLVELGVQRLQAALAREP